MIIKRRSNKNKILITLLACAISPWLIVVSIRLGQKGLELIKELPAWQQTPIWISLISMIGIAVGYLIFRFSRKLAIKEKHQREDSSRKLGVRLFGGGFTDVLAKISSDPKIRFKATGFAFIPRSIKGDIKTVERENPFPVIEFPVREAVKSFEGAVGERRKEEKNAHPEYMNWLNEQKDKLRCVLDIVGKGKGHTGLSCLHSWRWLKDPRVARFLVIVFDPEEGKPDVYLEDEDEEVEV